MIQRYDVKEISDIWTDQYKFETFLKVEIALLNELEKQKIIPKNTSKKFNLVKIKPKRIAEIEQTVYHDVIAFCSSITEQVDSKSSKFFHFGVTSSDIIDTALAIQIKESLKIVVYDLKKLLITLNQFSKEHLELICMGRSHGMNAEPMSFGTKWLKFYAEFSRRYLELSHFLEHGIYGKISGAVGNYTLLNPSIEENVLSNLGLKVEPISTQVVSRDHLAKLTSFMGLLANTISHISLEVRLLHHSDICEVIEGFKKGQKGSSTMPHKKNPIASENLTGLSRIIKSYSQMSMDNSNLWHERDISHSSAERIYLPDMFGLMSYSLTRLEKTISNLAVNKDNISKKLNQNFTFLSSYCLHQMILKLDLSREEIYQIVQDASFKAKNTEEFLKIINKTDKSLKLNLDLNHYKKMAKEVYKRVLTNYPVPNVK